MARAVVPCTAAAVDHADTELIGQTKKPDSLYTLIFELTIAKQGEDKNKALIKTQVRCNKIE